MCTNIELNDVPFSKEKKVAVFSVGNVIIIHVMKFCEFLRIHYSINRSSRIFPITLYLIEHFNNANCIKVK